MTDRIRRLFFVCPALILVAVTMTAQFIGMSLHAPDLFLSVGPTGVLLIVRPRVGWEVAFIRQSPWNAKMLVELPLVHTGQNYVMIFFPWWLILMGWGVILFVAWRWARKRKVGTAFPVETSF